MATWTFYTCGNCSKRIATEAQGTFDAIGIPYIECQHCGTVNDRSTKRQEWDLMSPLMRAGIYATVGFFGIFGGIGGASVLVLGADYAFGLSRQTAGALWLVLSVICACFGVKLCWNIGASAAIRESRARLTDAIYVQTLSRLGFVRSSGLDSRRST